MFWFITLCLTLLAILFLIVPLWRRTHSRAEESELRKHANIALFQERSDELEAELAEGNIDQSQFAALIKEMQQNLLADVGTEAVEIEQGDNRSQGQNRKLTNPLFLIPLLAVFMIPLLSYTLYQQWGYLDDVELMNLFQRTVDNQGDPREAETLIVSLGNIVMEDTGRTWAWYFLAENFATVGLFEEAETAYERAASQLSDSAERAMVLGRVALAKYINADFNLTAEVEAVIDQARSINPSEISSLQLLAADAEQRGDWDNAIRYWRLLIQVNPNSQQAQQLRANITAAQQLQGIDSSGEPTIEVDLRLADGIELNPGLRVFIAVRNSAISNSPPLAAVALSVADLPTTVSLDNSAAIGPFNLSSAETVVVTAMVSFSGAANPQSGDYRIESEPFSHNGQHTELELILSERIP